MQQLALDQAPTLARFEDKVRRDRDTGCWEWLGARKTGSYREREPYSNFKVNGQVLSAYRFIYEAVIGPVPDGLELDHLCRNRLCANPYHLEPVTHQENMRRSAAVLGSAYFSAKARLRYQEAGIPLETIQGDGEGA